MRWFTFGTPKISVNKTPPTQILGFSENLKDAKFRNRDHSGKGTIWAFEVFKQKLASHLCYTTIYIPLCSKTSIFPPVREPLLLGIKLKSRSTDKHEVIGPKAICTYLVNLNFCGFFPVVFGCSFLDSTLLFWFLSKSCGFLASNLKLFCWTGL